MAKRPSQIWREGVAQEAADLAAGKPSAEHAFMAALYPAAMLDRTDQVLAAFEYAMSRLQQPTDEQVFAAVEKAVLALNAINDDFDGAAYETGEREQLCDYIDATLTESGIDVSALAARHGLHRYALTDRWRDW